MITANTRALVKYRLEQGDESLLAARVLYEKGLSRQSLNRAYYAMFYAVLALLATRKRETSKHSSLPLFHNRHYGNLPETPPEMGSRP